MVMLLAIKSEPADPNKPRRPNLNGKKRDFIIFFFLPTIPPPPPPNGIQPKPTRSGNKRKILSYQINTIFLVSETDTQTCK